MRKSYAPLLRSAAAVAFSMFVAWSAAACVQADEEDDVGLTNEEYGVSRNPVIWLHGCPPPGGTADQGSHLVFDRQAAYFVAHGYPSNLLYRFVFQGAPCGSNIDYAAQLADYVQSVRAATGANKVDIVAHSMGSLAARLYMAQGGSQYVGDFVSLAGANHGTASAAAGIQLQAAFGYPAYEGMKEMFPPYACTGQTSGGAADVQAVVNGCLTATGRTQYVDETPGWVHWTTIRNTMDEVIVPNQSTCLDQRYQNDCSKWGNWSVTVSPDPTGPCPPAGCPAHLAMVWDPTVMWSTYWSVVHYDY